MMILTFEKSDFESRMNQLACAGRPPSAPCFWGLAWSAFLLVNIAAIAAASGKDEVPLLVVGEPTRQAVLKHYDAEGRLVFQSAEGEQAIPISNLVRWGHPVDAGKRTVVLLSDGSQLVAADAWKTDEQIRLGDETLRLTTRRCGPVNLPRELVRGVLLHPASDPLERERMMDAITDQTERADAVLLANGDRLRGIIRSLSTEQLSIKTTTGKMELKPSGVTAVLFDPAFLHTPPANGLRVLVGLRDGSLMVARKLKATDASSSGSTAIELETLGGARLRVSLTRDIVFLQPLGGKAKYLSDFAPDRYQHIPYLDIPWPYCKDRNTLGGRLRVGNSLYAKGIGVHSESRLVYKLNGQSERFAAEVAVDAAAGRRGSVVFRVFLAKEGKWHEAYASSIIRGGETSRSVAIELNAARGIALVVDYADYGDELDHADWLDARLE